MIIHVIVYFKRNKIPDISVISSAVLAFGYKLCIARDCRYDCHMVMRYYPIRRAPGAQWCPLLSSW
ncbi:hypothetical protein SERLA73DRAFT_179566 [Serpula lacrymans var. lacrymans S7.3]|uniref:Uncharacterized protein n=1 Tax=Serpula lacrymans var. lacrymans (strain S7.3) TaxID=936435 RepID=F8PVG4_SERL3|nr:hypothetical protein SERLA73DRAFT_179566 [Serpula lacrymans var. lacrymans S7.3]